MFPWGETKKFKETRVVEKVLLCSMGLSTTETFTRRHTTSSPPPLRPPELEGEIKSSTPFSCNLTQRKHGPQTLPGLRSHYCRLYPPICPFHLPPPHVNAASPRTYNTQARPQQKKKHENNSMILSKSEQLLELERHFEHH